MCSGQFIDLHLLEATPLPRTILLHFMVTAPGECTLDAHPLRRSGRPKNSMRTYSRNEQEAEIPASSVLSSPRRTYEGNKSWLTQASMWGLSS